MLPNYFVNYRYHTTKMKLLFSVLMSLWSVSWNVATNFYREQDLYKISVSKGWRNDVVLVGLKQIDITSLEAWTYSQLTKHHLENSRYLKMAHHSPTSFHPEQWWKQTPFSHLYFPTRVYVKSGHVGSLVFDLHISSFLFETTQPFSRSHDSW